METEGDARGGATGERAAPTGWRAKAFLELLGMCGLAIAQPVLGTFGNDALGFVNRRADALDVVAFAILVVLVPPVVLFVVELMADLASGVLRRSLHCALLGLLGALFVVQLLKVGFGGWVFVVLVAVFLTVAFAYAFSRYRSVGTWLRYLAFAPIAYVVLFLFFTPVRGIAWPSSLELQPLESNPAHPPIVFVVLDEFPAVALMDERGKIDPRWFPNLASFTRSATWYRNTTAPASWTTVAVPSVLTGRYPNPALQPVAAEHPGSLFTLLGGAYEMNVWEGPTRLCPSSLCVDPVKGPGHARTIRDLLGAATSIYAQRILSAEAERDIFATGVASTKPPVEIMRDFIASIHPSERPTLNFLHVNLPHQPWTLLPSGRMYDAPGPIGKLDEAFVSHDTAVAGYQRLILQTQATDHLVGELIERLRATGQYDQSLIVLTGDHGVTFDVGQNQRAASPSSVAEIGYPAMFVKYPGVAPDPTTIGPASGVSDAPAQTVDLIPTIADVLGVTVPWGVDGVSLRRLDPETARERRFYPIWLDTLPSNEHGYFLHPDLSVADRLASNIRQPLPPAREFGWYEFGSTTGLVGSRVDDLRVVAPLPVSYDLRRPQTDNTEPGRGPSPVFVDVLFDANPDREVAVAVNGTIAATGPVLEVNGRWAFVAVVPEEMVREGGNRYEMYVIEDGRGTGDGLTLRPLTR